MPLSEGQKLGLDRATATEKVYEAMIEELVSGRLHRNEKLQERKLAEYFRVSRTPLREAISKLEHDGFLISKPYRGVFVRDYTKEEVEALFELRTELEAMAGRLAAARATPDEIEAMQKTVKGYERMPPGEDVASNIRSTAELHILIARASHNPWLSKCIHQLQVHCSLLRHQSHLDPNRRKEIVQDHDSLVKAVEGGDSEKAEKIIRQHVDSARRFLIEHLFQTKRSQDMDSNGNK